MDLTGYLPIFVWWTQDLEFWCTLAYTKLKSLGGHRQTIFVTVNGIGPLGGEGVQLKSVKTCSFVTKIEISNISLSILKEKLVMVNFAAALLVFLASRAGR